MSEFEENWSKPLVRLREIAETAGVDLTAKGGALPPALAFAENLLLCPTEDAARALLLQDQQAAATFLETASFVAAQLRSGEIEWTAPMPLDRTPFCLPAVMVHEFLEGLQRERPWFWK